MVDNIKLDFPDYRSLLFDQLYHVPQEIKGEFPPWSITLRMKISLNQRPKPYYLN